MSWMMNAHHAMANLLFPLMKVSPHYLHTFIKSFQILLLYIPFKTITLLFSHYET